MTVIFGLMYTTYYTTDIMTLTNFTTLSPITSSMFGLYSLPCNKIN